MAVPTLFGGDSPGDAVHQKSYPVRNDEIYGYGTSPQKEKDLPLCAVVHIIQERFQNKQSTMGYHIASAKKLYFSDPRFTIPFLFAV